MLPTLDEVMPRLTHEVSRARRYHRPLAFAFLRTGRAGPATVRAIDVAARVGSDVQIVALPETTREGALGFIRRARPEQASAHDCRIAAFPDDAVTLAGILEHLLNGEAETLAEPIPAQANGDVNGHRERIVISEPSTNGGSHR